MRKSLRSRPQQALISALIEARKKAELTQKQLASRLGRSQSFVAKYEGGERRLDVIEFFEITQVLGIRAAAVFKRIAKNLTSR